MERKMIIGKPTPAQESQWYKRIEKYALDHGCFPYSNLCQYQMHHIKGRSFVHKKVACGGWAVLPIEIQFHDVHSNNEFNVTHYPKRYAAEFGRQVDQFVAMCAVIKSEDETLPFSDEVMAAIMELNV